VSPEATTYTPFKPNAMLIGTWKSPVNSKLLLQATFSHHGDNIDVQRPEGVGFDEISALEATTGMMFRSSSTLCNGCANYGHFDASTYRWLANATYVTGAHSAKVGMQIMHGSERFSSRPTRTSPTRCATAHPFPSGSTRRHPVLEQHHARGGALRAGSVEDRAAHAQWRHPVGLLQHELPRVAPRRRPVRTGARVSRK
jgi:hypothetical protein